MKTRRGFCYPSVSDMCIGENNDSLKRKRDVPAGEERGGRKRTKVSYKDTEFLDTLPDDLVISILCKISSTASSPADFINVLMTCKRLNAISLNSLVLSKASYKVFALKAKNWSESAHRFLEKCADAGNVEAIYTLGMIRFYCLENRSIGEKLIAKAAITSHAPAMYSLSVIKFNGSGKSKNEKDLRGGVTLCARAAVLGHVDAMREIGHCLQDGYGVKRNIMQGRRLLVQANTRELAAVLYSNQSVLTSAFLPIRQHMVVNGSPLLSDFGCNVPPPKAHPANQFITEWFAEKSSDLGLGIRLCSHSGCGRPETRLHEFRRCSVCSSVNYCSRACQALDWKFRHKSECIPAVRLENNVVVEGGVGQDGNIILAVMPAI